MMEFTFLVIMGLVIAAFAYVFSKLILKTKNRSALDDDQNVYSRMVVSPQWRSPLDVATAKKPSRSFGVKKFGKKTVKKIVVKKGKAVKKGKNTKRNPLKGARRG